MVSNYEVLDDSKSKKMQDACIGAMSPPEIKFLPSGLVLPKRYLNYAQKIREMEVRDDDVWVCSFPKCGTTWTQEMVWLLGTGLNYEGAASVELYKRFPFLEFTGLWPEETDIPDSVEFVENIEGRRFIKSHLPPSFLPKSLFEVNPKIIYVTRNPKDAACSYFHHFQMWNNYTGTLDEFLESFVEDKQIFSPFWDHVLSFWELKKQKTNVLIISFEDMKKNLSEVMSKTAKFLGVSYTEQEEVKLLDHLSFRSMKDNPMVNFENDLKEIGKESMKFIRKGEVEGWREEMTSEMSERFDVWTKNKLVGSDFQSYLNTKK